jgi:hypothetical protein
MTTTATMATRAVRVTDVSGQRTVKAPAVPASLTITELVQRLIEKMELAPNDSSGRPMSWQARLSREGRHLQGAETVGDALLDDDEIVLTPNIDAGR